MQRRQNDERALIRNNICRAHFSESRRVDLCDVLGIVLEIRDIPRDISRTVLRRSCINRRLQRAAAAGGQISRNENEGDDKQLKNCIYLTRIKYICDIYGEMRKCGVLSNESLVAFVKPDYCRECELYKPKGK